MRDEKIEKLLAIAGNEHRYQYFVLILFLILWINCNFMAPVLPYLEREPIVTHENENKSLTFAICKNSTNYKIMERFGYSWISEFKIECEKFKIGLIGAFTFVGNTMGSLAFAIIQRYLSHKNILLISSWGFIVSIYVSTLITDVGYFLYILLSLVFMGLFGDLLCYSSLVVCEEIVSCNKRALFSSIINMGYGLCGIIFSFIFMFVQNWRYDFYIVILLSFIIYLLIKFFVYESPRMYIDTKDVKNLGKILQGIAKFNGIEKEFLEKYQSEEYQQLINEIMDYDTNDNNKLINSNKEAIEMKEIEDENKKEELVENKNNNSKKKKEENKNISFFVSLKYPSLRYKFLILCVLWFGTRTISNAVALYSKALPGNYYWNIIILFIFESFAYYVSGVLINISSLGRKGTLYLEYFIIIVSFLLLSFFKFSLPIELTLNFIIRFCESAIELVYFTYTLEVYPTIVRSTNFGINVTFGNIGSILAPMIYEYLPGWLLLLIFAIMCIFHSFLLYFLPETEGKPMVETIEELENEKDNDKLEN